MSDLEALTRDRFQELVIESDVPVIVDFWGPRCMPCLALSPTYEKLAERHDGKLRMLKAEAPKNRMLCVDLKVMTLPTFLRFENGREVDRLVGQVTASGLSAWIDRAAEASAEGVKSRHG